MFLALRASRRLAAVGVAFGMFVASVGGVSAHARYDHANPDITVALDGSPFVLRASFTQAIMKASTIRVVDASGGQVDLGDGQVDTDDPDRKVMMVSMPALQPGLYTIQWSTISADDGDPDSGTVTFGIGMDPPPGGAATDAETTGNVLPVAPADQSGS
jgi:methionine-rich copper-binding protein CopC